MFPLKSRYSHHILHPTIPRTIDERISIVLITGVCVFYEKGDRRTTD